MSFGAAVDREIDRLEQEMEYAETEEERRAIREELTDIAREAVERERWEDEGYDRGWR